MIPRVRFLAVLASVLVLASPFEAPGQNLLQNPRFDSNLTGWALTTGFPPAPAGGGDTLTLSSSDAGGSSSSHSALLTNASGGILTLSQCVPVVGGNLFHVAFRQFVPSGQGTRPGSGIGVYFYGTPGCTGEDVYHFSGGLRAEQIVENTWQSAVDSDNAPANAVSALVFAYDFKHDTVATQHVYYDDAYFAQSRSETLTIPASASIHGQNGAFFHTDLWAVNASPSQTAKITARHRCFTGQSCGTGTRSISIAPASSYFAADVLASLFGDRETSGAIELTYDAALVNITAGSRTYTPSLPDPTFGTAIPALRAGQATTRAVFYGLGSNGADHAKGFRSNAGGYNPGDSAVNVVFALCDGATGGLLGSMQTTVGAHEAFQVNDVFSAVHAGTTVTTNAYLIVSSASPVFANATVIDNQSGDSVFIPAGDDPLPY